jgi:DNA-binding transcriptional MocR family regulator
MNEWLPRLEGRAGPRYRAIADALQQDITDGSLASGARLPTHRDLAWRLGVTVGTVTRAYVEAERRGLISGEVGRGTYVRPLTPDYPERLKPDERAHIPLPGRNEVEFIDLAGNAPPPAPLAAEIGRAFASVAEDPQFAEYLRYRPSQGLMQHREAGAQWLATFGHEVRPNQVLPTHGAQHAMLIAAAAVLRAGDVLLTEQLTFFGVKSVARVLGLRLHGVEMDAQGLLPAALDAAIRATGAKALYCIPTLQNPTNSVMPAERRQEIAEVCKRHGTIVIEDDIYNFLLDRPEPPLSRYLPEQSLYITNLSKSVAPALRVGYLAGPQALIDSALIAMRASSVMACPLTQETATRLIRNGVAQRNAELVREETRQRQAIARKILGHYEMTRQPAAFHVWLTLPEPWRREAFAQEALRRNLGVAAADVFATGRQSVPHAVRVSLAAPRTRPELEHGLGIIADILSAEGAANFPVI